MINVLERITHFRTLKGWTEYQLAEQSGLTQSTKYAPFYSFIRKNLCGFWHYAFPIFR